MIRAMGSKPRLDALEEQKIDTAGDHVVAKTGRELAKQYIADAVIALPSGVPDGSPYKRMTRDEMLAEAARLDMRIGALIAEDEQLRLVIEHRRVQITAGSAPPAAPPQEPAPDAPVSKVKIRGVRPSASNTWRVECSTDKPPQVSVGNGQMARLRNGSVIELRHYSEQIVQGIVDQGVKLIPVEDPEKDD